jgi:threonyl-tRNA synthetase
VEPEKLHRVRHSLAHILAQAVRELRPGSRLGFGPPIDDGLYYDFILSAPLSENDFPELERRMRRIIAANAEFVREELPLDEALARIDALGEPYKREYAREIAEKQGAQALSFYRSGGFVDMCEGPHVARASEIPADAFRIRAIAGAYWRGDSRNVMMTRIYVWAFGSRAELEARLEEHRLALERDHKKLGRELDLFVIDDEVGKGLPLWLPDGTAIRDELEKLMRELEFRHGYRRVATPQIAKSSLYRRTGHLPYYADAMYPAMELRESEGTEAIESYHLRPMNCPHHHKIFAARKRSYRELPLRLAEYGHVFRYEDSGALSGLLRVRGMCQNDAHIYCAEDQLEAELRDVLALYREAYAAIGIGGYRFRLSRHGDDASGKYVPDPDRWRWAEELLKRALEEEKLPYFEAEGEAAFYGPKIDVQLRSVTGREETASTIQLDISSARRLDLRYVGADNREHPPFIIHRAPLGTHERTVAFLVEHYGGAMPLWLAPTQVAVLPVAERFNGYAREVERALRDAWIRAEADLSSETLSRKIRRATLRKAPAIAVVGEREEQARSVALRRRGGAEPRVCGLPELVSELAAEIRRR